MSSNFIIILKSILDYPQASQSRILPTFSLLKMNTFVNNSLLVTAAESLIQVIKSSQSAKLHPFLTLFRRRAKDSKPGGRNVCFSGMLSKKRNIQMRNLPSNFRIQGKRYGRNAESNNEIRK